MLFVPDWARAKSTSLHDIDIQRFQHFPEVLHKMNLILIAHEFKRKITSSHLINTTKFQTHHFGPSKSIEKKFQVYPTVAEKNKEPANDIKKIVNDIKSFYEETTVDIHPCLLLQAITLEISQENLNLERMEYIGDAFLQYVATIKCYTEHPEEDKSKLNSRRTNIVQNSFLYKKAEEKNIGSYVHAIPFQHCTWCPPGYNIQPKNIKLKDKSLSDVIEAIIGVFLLAKGHNPAIDVMCWLNLIENPSTIPGYRNMSTVEDGGSSEELNEQGNTFEEFEKFIRYKFINKIYLSTAFTPQKHQENEELSYEKLLFIGEAVLYYLITRVIFDRFGCSEPAEMTSLRAKVNNTFVFSCLAVKNKLNKFLHLKKVSVPVILKNIKDFKKSMAFQKFEVSSTVSILKLFNLN